VTVADGVETERVLVTERVIQEPVNELIGHGTMRSTGRVVASRSQKREFTPPTGRTLDVEATGYAPNVDGVGTRTATGDQAGYGIIAVDPRVIPLGTKLYVPGYGFGVAADTGGAIKGNRIDLCYNTGDEAIQWGRRDVTITIVQ
jgi:3D (Asp-Asp-Asp) domain-containing protein